MPITVRQYARLLSGDQFEGWFRKSARAPQLTKAYPAWVIRAFDGGYAQTATAGAAEATAVGAAPTGSLGVAGQNATANAATATAVGASPFGLFGTPISFADDFNRVDGTLGANWVNVGSSLFAVSSNRAKAAAGSPSSTKQLAAVAPSAAVFAPDHEASVTVSSLNGFDFVGPAVRVDAAAGTGYGFYIDTGTRNVIVRVAGGVAQAFMGTAFSVAVGDRLTLRAVGSTIIALRNGVPMATVTDATYPGGQPGLAYDFQNSRGSAVDDFLALGPQAVAQTATAGVAVASAVVPTPTASIFGGVAAGLTVTITQGGRVIATRFVPVEGLTSTMQAFSWSLTDGERMGVTDVDVTPLEVALGWEPLSSGATVEVDAVALSLYPPTLVGPPQTATAEAAVATAVGATPDATLGAGGQTATADAAVSNAVAVDASRTAGGVTRTADVATATATGLVVTRTAGGVTVTVQLAIGTAAAADATRTAGGVSRTAEQAVGTAVAVDTTRSAGAVTRTADTAIGTGVALGATASSISARTADTAVASTTMYAVSFVAGGLTRTAAAAIATATGANASRTAGGVSRVTEAAVATGTGNAVSWSATRTMTAGYAVAVTVVADPSLQVGGPYLNGIQWVLSRMSANVHVGARYNGVFSCVSLASSSVSIRPKVVPEGIEVVSRVQAPSITAVPAVGATSLTAAPKFVSSVVTANDETSAITLLSGEP